MSPHLRVNPIACDAHGLCAELLPELVELDEWGYPLVSPDPVPPRLLRHVRRAVSACPTLALLLERESPAPSPQGNGRTPGFRGCGRGSRVSEGGSVLLKETMRR